MDLKFWNNFFCIFIKIQISIFGITSWIYRMISITTPTLLNERRQNQNDWKRILFEISLVQYGCFTLFYCFNFTFHLPNSLFVKN